MILSKQKNIKTYLGISKNLDTALNFILNNDLTKLPYGRNEIDGDNVYLNIMDYQTGLFNELKFEGHHNYIDIHIVLQGDETIAITTLEDIDSSTPYEEDKDVYFAYGNKYTSYYLDNTNLAITFPEDLHMHKIYTNYKDVKKAVVKIKM